MRYEKPTPTLLWDCYLTKANAESNALAFAPARLPKKVEVLSTPAGNILRELFRNGIKLGISSRGLGSVKQVNEDTVAVQDDFELVCWDFVSNPSTHGAFMAPVNESVTSKKLKLSKYYKVNNIINEMLCDLTCKCSLPS